MHFPDNFAGITALSERVHRLALRWAHRRRRSSADQRNSCRDPAASVGSRREGKHVNSGRVRKSTRRDPERGGGARGSHEVAADVVVTRTSGPAWRLTAPDGGQGPGLYRADDRARSIVCSKLFRSGCITVMSPEPHPNDPGASPATALGDGIQP
jgi:hypothetical protein